MLRSTPRWIIDVAPGTGRAAVAVCLAGLLLCAGAGPAEAQEAEADARLALFLDCAFCDGPFIRQAMPYVDHVLDREVADVHVIVTREQTGAGGEARTFDVIGLGRFEGTDFSTVFTAPADATEAEVRDGTLRTLEAALVPYLLRTPVRDRLRVEVAPQEEDAAEVPATDDPWNLWTVELYADGSADVESQRRSFDTRYGVFVGRVTEDWKLQVRPFFNYTYDRFDREGEQPITSSLRRDGVTSYAVRSVSPHWSVGAYADVLTSTFANVEWRYRAMGAVEWSLYPYREANRRQLTVAYRLGGSDITYRDSTIFDKVAQRVGQHVLNAGYEVVQPWGEVEVGVDASQYLHDPSLYSVQLDAGVEVRVMRGLSVGVGGFLELIQDQINLPKGDADLEEVLLRRRQLATDYEAGLRFGVRYRFGSLLNNVVNPRLGGVGNRDRF